MARMPVFDDQNDDQNDDEIEITKPTVSVPKGWAVEDDGDEDDTDQDEWDGIEAPGDTDGDEDEDEDGCPNDDDIMVVDEQPVRPTLKPKYDTVVSDQPVTRAKKKPSWVEYDEDDIVPEPKPVTLTDVLLADAEAEPVTTKKMPVFEADHEVPSTIVAKPIKAAPKPKLSITRLSERAMLVSLNISQWSGRRFDRKVTDEVNSRKAASNKAGRYTKALLPECVELEEIHRQTSSLRNWFVDQTLPWLNDGGRIMPSKRYMAFNAEFRQRVIAHSAAVETFINNYPALLRKAPSQLPGGMFDPEDYPHVDELRAKFSVAVRVLPLPDKGDFRVDLDDAVMAEINAGMADHENDLATIVAADCVLRLSKVVSAMAERLADQDAVFRDSLVDNIVEVIDVVADLNITDDPEVEALRLETEMKLAVYTPDELRIDMSKRKATAKAAAAIASKMSALMGA